MLEKTKKTARREKVKKLHSRIYKLRTEAYELRRKAVELERQLERELARYVRHVISKAYPTCWCGSNHSWTLAKHGYCQCKNKRCTEVHREVDDA